MLDIEKPKAGFGRPLLNADYVHFYAHKRPVSVLTLLDWVVEESKSSG
jgi:hypothetical protein